MINYKVYFKNKVIGLIPNYLVDHTWIRLEEGQDSLYVLHVVGREAGESSSEWFINVNRCLLNRVGNKEFKGNILFKRLVFLT